MVRPDLGEFEAGMLDRVDADVRAVRARWDHDEDYPQWKELLAKYRSKLGVGRLLLWAAVMQKYAEELEEVIKRHGISLE